MENLRGKNRNEMGGSGKNRNEMGGSGKKTEMKWVDREKQKLNG